MGRTGRPWKLDPNDNNPWQHNAERLHLPDSRNRSRVLLDVRRPHGNPCLQVLFFQSGRFPGTQLGNHRRQRYFIVDEPNSTNPKRALRTVRVAA